MTGKVTKMRRLRWGPGLARALALALLAAALGAVPAAARPATATPGATSIGDPLFPKLGNGGYDVRHYTLYFSYPSTASVQEVSAVASIRARATESLSRFSLDFSGDTVATVTVNGRPARFARTGEKLVITPARSIGRHRRFVVRVRYTSGPREVDPNAPFDQQLAVAWFATPSGSITAGQPSFAHRIFPANDHPSDLATYTIRASTPAASTFVANGELAGRRTRGERTRWTYREREPMASELIQLAFGALTVRSRGFDRGVALRDVAPTASIDALEPALARVRDHLDWMTTKVGPYPFTTYGSLFSDAEFGFALETQTLSLYPAFLFTLPAPYGPNYYEPIMVHELAHQWYGDRVTPARWSDVWLNEGHATWYEWEYAQERGWTEVNTGRDFEARMRNAYANGDRWRADFGPVAAPTHGADDVADLFSPNVYDGGALVLYALRQVIGDPAFRRLERLWPRLYGGHPASTDDFIALASRVAHRDLRRFLRAWLYGTTTPPMPGHPDWTVAPVTPAPALALRARVAGRDLAAFRP